MATRLFYATLLRRGMTPADVEEWLKEGRRFVDGNGVSSRRPFRRRVPGRAASPALTVFIVESSSSCLAG
eukprot:975903-Lingulodinium_polyedra.AAC.1